MSTDITIVFVYAKGKKIKVLYLGDAAKDHKELIDKGWRRTNTLDPCLWIQNLHNNCSTYEQVEEIDRLNKKI